MLQKLQTVWKAMGIASSDFEIDCTMNTRIEECFEGSSFPSLQVWTDAHHECNFYEGQLATCWERVQGPHDQEVGLNRATHSTFLHREPLAKHSHRNLVARQQVYAKPETEETSRTKIECYVTSVGSGVGSIESTASSLIFRERCSTPIPLIAYKLSSQISTSSWKAKWKAWSERVFDLFLCHKLIDLSHEADVLLGDSCLHQTATSSQRCIDAD